MSVTREQVLQALSGVNDPELNKSLVELNMIRNVAVGDGNVSFQVVLTTPACPMKSRIKDECSQAVMALQGVNKVQVEMTSDVRQGPVQDGRQPIQGVRNIIAVASGKGGVGKSTVAVHLALALSQSGAKVGLLDADIHGPNIPLMMGLSGQSPEVEDEEIIPMEQQGLKIMSIGLLVPRDKAIIWRGPMLHNALMQFMRQVRWAPLDYLVVDLPPGTGDAHLSMVQTVPISGAVIVTTPQEAALADVRKGIDMFHELKVPILGVVENMSYFLCPHCKERTDIFSHGGGQRSAGAYGVSFLGEVPIDTEIRKGGDEGRPMLLSAPDSPVAEAFRGIASRVAARLSVLSANPAAGQTAGGCSCCEGGCGQ